jgi:outer membrane protein OmpA-like peptidoglycan-associated protein
MYFSSDGRPGMGGHDIYFVRKQPNGNWGEVKNIGYPINSELDEFGMIADPSGRLAYYASEKEGGLGMLDIYQFDLYKDAQPITSSYLKGRVTNAETKSPLKAMIQLIDLATEEIITSTESDKLNGSFLASLPANKNYALNVSKEGFLFYSDNFELKEQTATEPKVLQIELTPIKKGASMVLKNVFFETGSFELKNSSKVELDKLLGFMKVNPKVAVEIGGHTDNVGSAELNKELSKNRADAVRDYLVNNGASAGRIIAVGYGDSKPLADNETEEGRAKNRRTEFVVR